MRATGVVLVMRLSRFELEFVLLGESNDVLVMSHQAKAFDECRCHEYAVRRVIVQRVGQVNRFDSDIRRERQKPQSRQPECLLHPSMYS